MRIVATCLILALIGGLLWASFAMRKAPFESVSVNTYNLSDVPRHPVTNKMENRATAMVGESVPALTLPTTDDPEINLRSATDEKPMVIVMTKDGCPCSIESQPYFSELSEKYKDAVMFIGIIEGNRTIARKYQSDFDVPYAMAYVNSVDVFKQFDAKQSVYTFLVGKGGTLLKVWPGYSQSSLIELNHLIASETSKAPVSADFSMATKEMTSGCFFFQPIGSDKPAWEEK